MKNGEIYYKDSRGKTHYLGKLADFIFDEIVSDITDVIEPTVEYEEFIKKFKRNQDHTITFSVSNVNKDVLIKEFIEPYIQYEFERELIYSWIKNYRYEQMKAQGMSDRDIVLEEIYKKHCWKYYPRN